MNSFMDWFWLMIWWFLFFAFLMVLFQIFGDLFRDHSMGGWGKALWVIGLIFVPVVGSLVYLIARGKGMAERRNKEVQQMQAAQADYIRSVAASSGGAGAAPSAADQIAQAKALLDAGTISQAEFDRMKAKALA